MDMKITVQLLIPSVLLILIFARCETKTKYQKLLDSHYVENAGNDSLFLGYHFGMSRQEFYDHSWELNGKGLVREGDNNESVLKEVTSLKSRAKKNFFPLFYQDSIYSMPVKYSYSGWAPWNKDLWADSLELDILALYEKRYNQQFQQVMHPEQNVPSHMLIKGNKRISIYKMDDDKTVAVEYVDLDVLQKISSEK